MLETANREANAPFNEPLLDDLFDGPAVLRERMTMLRVLLVIRVGTLRDEVVQTPLVLRGQGRVFGHRFHALRITAKPRPYSA